MKLDKLAQRIQDFQKFISIRSAQSSDYAGITQFLSQLSNSLRDSKPILGICGRSPELVQALKAALSSERSLDHFQIKIIPYPESVSSQPAVSVCLQMLGGQTLQYSLKQNSTLLIGRHPACDIPLAEQFNRSSSQHAELRWDKTAQICDRNSRNGTFVNGQRIEGCRELKESDSVTFAYPSATDKTPTLKIELPTQTEAPQSFADCHVLCIVRENQALSSDERTLIEQAKQNLQCFVVVNASHGQTVDREMISLNLDLFRPNQATMVEMGAQPDFVQFAKRLSSIASEDLVLQKSNQQLSQQIDRIKQLFDLQDRTLTEEIQQLEQQLSAGNADLKEQVRKAIKKANDDRDKFFRQAKLDFDQSKRDMLDKMRKGSILGRIREQIEGLTARVVQRRGQTYLQLYSQTANTPEGLNQELTYFCRSQLSEWGTREWQNICSSYGEGGWFALLQRMITTLKVIPSLRSPDELKQTLYPVDLNRVLADSAIECECELPYKNESLAGYLFKNTRGQIQSILSLMALVGVAVGLDNAKKAAQAPIILFPLLLIVIGFSIFSYQQNKTTQLRDETEKLKEKVGNHYQELGRNLTERLAQSINLKLDAENQRLREAIDAANEQFNQYLTESDKQQIQERTRLAEKKTRQMELKRDCLELDRLSAP
ncbi:MAG: FHA domain-containing protein [Phormidium tanganyikae FI6-MK23]|nr:FHA domain-containing protein [Phormidium tanganyikae FI6-MK23]